MQVSFALLQVFIFINFQLIVFCYVNGAPMDYDNNSNNLFVADNCIIENSLKFYFKPACVTIMARKLFD